MSSTEIYVITGANRGIGLELTRQALARGHRVIAGARVKNLTPELTALAAQETGRCTVIDLDVQSDASVASFTTEVSRAFGPETSHVDVLINNAGIFRKDDTSASETSPVCLLETFNTNAVGPARVTQALLPLLKRALRPRVVHITSKMGSITDNSSGGSVAYRMSKTALNMYMTNLALEEKGVITLALHPGWVKTAMGGVQAPLSPEASADGLLRLIEEAKSTSSGKFLDYAGREIPW
jgi:NAD(P)-dependent dehydrogenase (short-subunit alcohol dehydrogenase family)